MAGTRISAIYCFKWFFTSRALPVIVRPSGTATERSTKHVTNRNAVLRRYSHNKFIVLFRLRSETCPYVLAEIAKFRFTY